MELTSDQERGVEIFKDLLKQYQQALTENKEKWSDPGEMELWVLREAHSMWRSHHINSEIFATIMDEAVCW